MYIQKKKFKEKIKSVYREISYAILPFFIFVMVLVVSYFGNQLIYSLGWTHGSNWCEIELDKIFFQLISQRQVSFLKMARVHFLHIRSATCMACGWKEFSL